ncbi:hypothetical protein [Paragemmobacter ruber]|uniref:5-carboxymethyl-2-hydroxymuconate isomerase n=1 Tax=Paragemmobacter ruber TaxID=1985673 RepID=A0ABW9Y372_9RHOB|nr:hypothetical protein [Rhodobacter ruber]NBE06960.1 hypothetical protein [Rhodobacter ruber]
MPNVKLYVDDGVFRDRPSTVDALLPRLRDLICSGLGVTTEACHIVALVVRSLPGQTPVNIELCLLHKPGRTRAALELLCGDLRDLAARALDAPAAVRCTLAEPENYIVIRAG